MTTGAHPPESRESGLVRSHAAGEDSEPYWSPAPIIGYRFWHYREGGVQGAYGAHWLGAELRATCRGPRYAEAPHHAGMGDCRGRCGIYAFDTPEALIWTFAQRLAVRSTCAHGHAPEHDITEALFGAVSLSGKVVEHEDGYRAERATVIGVVRWSWGGIWSTTLPRLMRAEFGGRVLGHDEQWHVVRTATPGEEVRADVVGPLIVGALRRIAAARR